MEEEEAPGRATEGNSNVDDEGFNLDSHDTAQQSSNADCIYSRGVWLYRQAGWRGVLPLPPRDKQPPPKGFTGYDGTWPTDEQIERWVIEKPADANLGLRLGYGFAGIDVDAYGDKTGGLTLAEAERHSAALPATYRSTARIDDPVSGIRPYKVPLGVLFRGNLKFVLDDGREVGHIEIIQPHHRLVVGWPSIHPKTGQVYRWFAPDGRLLPEGEVPYVEDIPELPEAWVIALSRDSVREEVFDGSAPNRPRDAVVDERIYAGLMELNDNGAPDAVVDARLQKTMLELTSGAGSRYDHTRDSVAALMRMHSWGRVGVPRALSELFTAYVLEVADTRPRRVAEAEFWRFTEGAAMLIAATSPSDPWRTMGTADDETTADGTYVGTDTPDESRSWTPADLTDLLDGSREPMLPTLFERADGNRLLYPGLVHSLHGESESGKSLIVQAECVRLLNRNEDVLYIDFDSDARSVVDRLLEFGADSESIAAHFRYLQPEVRPESSPERAAWEEVLSAKYTLVVIDGVTDALGVFGCSTNDNDDVARWIRTVPKQIAARTGAAVVLIDHVVKDPSNRNRFAIGGQAKMAGLTGAAYTVDVIEPLGRGLRGEVVLRIAKDRPGEVRRHCVSFRKKDRTQEAARIVVDSTVEPLTVTIEVPGAHSDENSCGPTAFRPTNLMQRVSEEIEQHPGQLTRNQAVKGAGGRRETTLRAFDILDSEGYLTSERGRAGYPVYTMVKSYREIDDPLSDRHVNLGNHTHAE